MKSPNLATGASKLTCAERSPASQSSKSPGCSAAPRDKQQRLVVRRFGSRFESCDVFVQVIAYNCDVRGGVHRSCELQLEAVAAIQRFVAIHRLGNPG